MLLMSLVSLASGSRPPVLRGCAAGATRLMRDGPYRDTAPMAPMATDEVMMRRALALAEQAAGHDDVPIGAVVARGEEVLGEAGNERELRRDPTAHAEVLALRQAAERIGGAGELF